MQKTISLTKKENFISWFIDNYQYENNHTQWFLYLIRNDEAVLKKIYFVNDNSSYSKVITLSALENIIRPMQYQDKKGTFQTNDPREMYEKIKNNLKENIYIQLNYFGCNECEKYLEVTKWETSSGGILKEADYLLRKFDMLTKINNALDGKDEKVFYELTDKLKIIELEKSIEI